MGNNGLNVIKEGIAEYAESLSSDSPDYIIDLHRATHLRVTNGRMISDLLQGRLLSMISHLLKPALVLDIGTFTGFSALCLSEGLATTGRLITLDINDELESLRHEFFARSPYQQQIESLIIDALEYVEQMDISPDLVFLDADKSTYPQLLKALKPKLKSGAYLLIDNTLWYGKVAQKEDQNDPRTQVLKDFNLSLKNDETFETVIIPMRDGLTLIRKK